MVKAGDCFWIETNQEKKEGHLFVIVLEPEEFTRNTVIIPVDSYTSDKQDSTTILNPGDHDFIKHKSFLNYNRARIRTMTSIEQMIKDGKAKTKPAVSSDILERITDGLRKSEHTPQEVITMYTYYMFRKLKK